MEAKFDKAMNNQGVYTYDQLSEEAKENVYLNSLDGYEDFFERAKKLAKEAANKVFADNKPEGVEAEFTLYYSGGWDYQVSTDAEAGSEAYKAVMEAADMAVAEANRVEDVETEREAWEAYDEHYTNKKYDVEGNEID